MPRFSPGDRVTVLDLGKPGHVRIPGSSGTRPGGSNVIAAPIPIRRTSPSAAPASRHRPLPCAFPQTELWPDYAGPTATRWKSKSTTTGWRRRSP